MRKDLYSQVEFEIFSTIVLIDNITVVIVVMSKFDLK